MKKILIILVVVFIFSCEQDENQNSNNTLNLSDELSESALTEDIIPLFSDISYPEDIITVNTEEELSFTSKSGSEIIVPDHTFVDKNGKDVEGNVVVKFKEYRSAADIILNDLDMKYDSGGVTYNFKTAGMFKLEAFKDGQPVFIKKDKGIDVNFISEVEGDYNFYKYQNGNWVYKEPMKAKVTVEKKDNNIMILKPVKLDSKRDLVIDITSSYKHLDELKDYDKILWRYAGNSDPYDVKITLSKRVLNPEIERSEKSGIYIYKFKQGKEDKTLKIEPVFTGKAYISANRRFNNTLNRGSGNVRVSRKMRITELGLMNYDIISKQDDAIFVKCMFYIKDKDENKEPANGTIFHIAGDDMVIKQKSGTTLAYSASYNNRLVAVLPGNRIAVMNSETFNSIMVGKKQNDNTEFLLSLNEEPINSIEDLEGIISTL